MYIYVYVCRDCAMESPSWTGLESYSHRLCHVCRKECEPENLTFRKYLCGDIFNMDKTITLQRRDIDELIGIVRLLEAHIKYQPGGEGALEALIHYAACTDDK